MYAVGWKSEHIVWREQCYIFLLGVLLQIDFYIIWKDQVFVVDVMIIDLI